MIFVAGSRIVAIPSHSFENCCKVEKRRQVVDSTLGPDQVMVELTIVSSTAALLLP